MDRVGEYTLKAMKKAKWYNRWLLTFIDKYLNGDILEVGAGIGNFSKMLKKYGKITVIDINRKYLNNCRIGDINCGLGDIEKGEYFFKDKKFDSIISLNVIEHIKDDSRAFRNISQLLNKNGTAVILVPAHKMLYSKYDNLLGHYRRYIISDVKKLIGDIGLEIVDIRYINWWGAVGWLFFMKLLKRTDFPENELGIFDTFGKFLLWPEKILKLPFGLSVLVVVRRNKRY